MYPYLLRRLLLMIPVLIGVTFLVFSIIRLIPGDPATAIAGEMATPQLIALVRKELGLDEPMLKQYGIYLQRLAVGDLGKSLRSGVKVSEELSARLPNTLKLAIGAIILAAVVGIAAGVTAATRPNSWFDTGSMGLALVGVSMPVFWLGVLLMLLFSIKLPKLLGFTPLPPTGTGTWRHLILPTITLGVNSMAILARMTRSTMMEVLGRDYIRTARAKGLAQRVVVYKHALKNAMIPILTVMGLQFGTLLGGAVLTETVFTWPGIGRLIVDGILYRDYPLVQATVLVIALGVILVNLVVDLLYGLLDPRIRYS
jgi:peptide/nickel transport system permease protein